MITKQDIKKELDFCIQLRETQWWCSFNKKTTCEQCASMSVLRKLYSWEVLDGKKLSLQEWKDKIN